MEFEHYIPKASFFVFSKEWKFSSENLFGEDEFCISMLAETKI